MNKVCSSKLWPETKFYPSSSFLWRSCCVCASSWSSSLGWIEELCSQQPSLVGNWSRVLGSTQLVSHVLGSHASKGGTITTEQVQLGNGVRVQL